MAVGIRTATGTTSATATTTLTITKPTGTASGDVLIASISVDTGSSITITPPTGWTLVTRQNLTTTVGQGVYYKVAGGSEPTSYAWTLTSCICAGTMQAYSGVDNNNPIAGWATSSISTRTTAWTFPATIPQAETAYPVLLLGGSASISASVTVTTASSGWTSDIARSIGTAPNVSSIIEDQHALTSLPLASLTPGTTTLSVASNGTNVVLFLRPTVTTTTGGFSIDVATFASELTDTGGSVTTASFSTGYANETLFAILSGDDGTAFTQTVTGGSLTWTQQIHDSTAHGSSSVWTALATSPLSNVTVTASDTSNASTSWGMTLYSMTGVNLTTPVGASAQQFLNAAGALSKAVTTTAANSWVWANYNDYTANTAPTAGTSQTKASDIANAADGNRYAVIRQTAVTATSGTSVTMSTTAPTADSIMAIAFEILAPSTVNAAGQFFAFF